jgi:hypothetical protein
MCNVRAMTGFGSLFRSPGWVDIVLCQNHQQHLVCVAALSIFSLSIVNNLYSASLFLQADGHFRRLLYAVDIVVSQMEVRPSRE